jgi:hypothetical protein
MTSTNAPARLSDHLPRPEGSPRRPLLGLLAVIGSLALLVGVPLALVVFVGNPLPTEAPSTQWLTASVTPWLVIRVFAILLWCVWAHFVVCFVTEWRALVRGALPSRIVTGGGSQLLARQLVSGILLLSGGASLAHGVAGLGQEESTPVERGSGTAAVATESAAPDQHSASTPADATDKQSRTEALGPARKFTTVRPPQGRHHDTVWDIAQRTLGDPFRYGEIYDLNRDRIMPDGRRFADADLIHPGWQLFLPPDASGPDVEPIHDHHDNNWHGPRPNGAGRSSDTSAADRGSDPQQADSSGVDQRGSSKATSTGAPTDQGNDSPLGSLLLGGGLILAGIVRAVTARSGPFGAPDPLADRLGDAAALLRADFVDQALRSLAWQRREAGLLMPEVRFAYVDDERLVLHLVGIVPAPAAPWVASEDRQAWTLARHALSDQASEPIAAPYPSLVNVAAREGFDILLDLETAPGVVALVGNAEVARDLATAMAFDLSTHPWSDSVRVFMVGFGEHFVDAGSGRAEAFDDLDDVIDQVSHGQSGQAEVLARLGVQGVLQGRLRGESATCEPVVVFLSGSPTAAQSRRLSDLTMTGRTSFSVVCVGDTQGARWRLSVDGAGNFDAPALGINGVARRLTLDAQRRLRTMLADADRRRTDGAAEFDNSAPARVAERVAASPLTSTQFQASSVRVRLLGPVRVEAGEVDDSRRGLLTEVVVMASLHPDGIHDAVLRSSLWPRGVEGDVVRSRLVEAQDWLGPDTEGAPLLHIDPDGRIRLSARVVNDYGVLRAAAQHRGPGELDELIRAVRLASGEAFSGAGTHYHWMTFVREARQCRLLSASVARRAADLAAAQGDIDVAREALELGLVLVPNAEGLWRQLLRLHATHNPPMVDQVIDKMYSTLIGRGVKEEPETGALVGELRPDRDRAVGI